MCKDVKSNLSQEELKIFEALENPKYKWRTIDGIVNETFLAKDIVSVSLEHLSEKGLIITASNTTSTGDTVYASKDEYFHGGRYFVNRIVSALTSEIK